MPIRRQKVENESEVQAQSHLEVKNKDVQNVQTEFVTSVPKYKFSDMILPNEIKDKLNDVISFSKYKDVVYEKWGLKKVLKQQSGLTINLYGESGTGKTMTAHAIASDLNKKLICVNYSELESKYVGETSKNLTRLFKTAEDNDAIIFFDEADAMLSKRVTNMSNSTDVSVNQTRSVLLTLMNDYNGMIIFTTNFISNFDQAFMRRINYHIKYDLPNEAQRKRLWENYIPEEMPTNIDVKKIAHKYAGLSGSDIANAVLASALKAARLGENEVKHEYFEIATEDILKSKKDNIKAEKISIEQREVSEEYALSQLGKAPLK